MTQLVSNMARTRKNIKATMAGGSTEGAPKQPGFLNKLRAKFSRKTSNVGQEGIRVGQKLATSNLVLKARIKGSELARNVKTTGSELADSTRHAYNTSFAGDIGKFKRKFQQHLITLPCGYKCIVIRPDDPILETLASRIGLSTTDALSSHVGEYDTIFRNNSKELLTPVFNEWRTGVLNYVYYDTNTRQYKLYNSGMVDSKNNTSDKKHKLVNSNDTLKSILNYDNRLRLIMYKDRTLGDSYTCYDVARIAPSYQKEESMTGITNIGPQTINKNNADTVNITYRPASDLYYQSEARNVPPNASVMTRATYSPNATTQPI